MTTYNDPILHTGTYTPKTRTESTVIAPVPNVPRLKTDGTGYDWTELNRWLQSIQNLLGSSQGQINNLYNMMLDYNATLVGAAIDIYRLPVATDVNILGQLDSSGITGEYLSGVTNDIPAWATLNQSKVAGLRISDSPVFVTVKCSSLTDGRIPLHLSDAWGLVDSPMLSDGSVINIGGSPYGSYIFTVWGNIYSESGNTDPALHGVSNLGNAVYGDTVYGIGVSGYSERSNGIMGESKEQPGIYGVSEESYGGWLLSNIAALNTLEGVLKVERGSVGTSLAGIGGSIDYYIADNAGNPEIAGKIGCILTNVGHGTEVSALTFYTRTGGAAVIEMVRITNSQVTLGTSLISDTDSTDSLGSAAIAWANTYSDKVFTSTIAPQADGTTALQFTKADGTTAVLNIDTTNSRIGIFETTPLSAIHAGIEWPGAAASNIIEILDSYGDQGRLVIRVANGTKASPTKTISGGGVGNINARGHDGTNFSTTGRWAIAGTAAEDFTSTAQGTHLLFSTTPIGSVTQAEAIRITSEAKVGIGNAPSTTGPKLGVTGYISWSGQKRTTAQFNKTSNTTVADITGLSVNVEAGKTYYFRAQLFISTGDGGFRYAIGGTCTATAIIANDISTIGGVFFSTYTLMTALGTEMGTNLGVCQGQVQIEGTITVNAAGTLTVKFAQWNSNAVASSVLTGSTFIVEEMA